MPRKKRTAEQTDGATETPGTKRVKAKATAKAEQATPKEEQHFYLLKSEPHEFSIDDLEAAQNSTEPWDGVRNFQARNIMRAMRLGDRCFFYHSNCKEPGVVGIAEVARLAYPDYTAADPASGKFDAKHTADDPRWFMVDVKLVRKLGRLISLRELKEHVEGGLKGMALLTKGRLSVQPVTLAQWDFVLGLEGKEAPSS